ncbi:MAG TPA: hypothetical protein VFR67_07480, partial [Pilimelia sp.]|nr:hypothetical protein [Pilimelia sp.]
RTAALLSAGLTGLATAATLAAGAAAVSAETAAAAAPASSVSIRNLPNSFKVGGGPGPLTIVVAKRSRGCVLVRRALTVQLPGLAGGQLRVERLAGGEWREMPLTPAGNGAWTAAERAPDPRPLCAGDSIAARFRVAFLPGAPAGMAAFVAQAFGGGQPLGSDGASRGVTGAPTVTPTPTRPAATPTPTPTPTASLSPTPTTAAPTTETALAAEGEDPAAVVPAGGSGADSGPGIGVVVMVLGFAMVAIGAGLLVVLLRRSRGEPGDAGSSGDSGPSGPSGPGGGDPNPTLVLPPVRG